MNRKIRAAAHSMGETRDDAGNADADLPVKQEEPTQGKSDVDLPGAAERRPQGEGPRIDDDDEGLGPPSGHGD